MVVPALSIIAGLVILVWAAGRFVEGASSLATHLSVPPLLIGIVILGFGTSAPEMMVSTFAALEGNPGLALGNAYGSNIANIALILGLTATICPIAVHSSVVRRELPILLAITAASAALIYDTSLSRVDALLLLVAFGGLMAWSIWEGMRAEPDPLADQIETEVAEKPMTVRKALTLTVFGLVVLIVSSRLLVWGAVEIAGALGVPDLVIGLTIVAVGTSLPELAASLTAALKGEADMALGNVLGSNLFNTLVVVGIAGAIHPMKVPPEVLERDILVMAILTIALFVFCFRFGRVGVLNRIEGSMLLAGYAGYTIWLVRGVI